HRTAEEAMVLDRIAQFDRVGRVENMAPIELERTVIVTDPQLIDGCAGGSRAANLGEGIVQQPRLPPALVIQPELQRIVIRVRIVANLEEIRVGREWPVK